VLFRLILFLFSRFRLVVVLVVLVLEEGFEIGD
jgi:hypothetical protein